jgi:CHRD domain
VLPFKTVQSPIEGTATLTENQAADLLAGKWYANIHTAANPGGELRGQMMK